MSGFEFRSHEDYYDTIEKTKERLEELDTGAVRHDKLQLLEEIEHQTRGPKDDNGAVNDEVLVSLLDEVSRLRMRLNNREDES